MKNMKIALLSIMFSLSMSVSAQKIIADKMIGDIRYVETSVITARHFTDKVVWNFGLRGLKGKLSDGTENIAYLLVINLNAMKPIEYPEGTTLLLKNMDDDVVELKSINEYRNTPVIVGYTTTPPLVGNVGTVTANTITRNIAEFVIMPDELEKLKTGVKKVRVQTASGYLENEYKKDKCGAELYKSYELIKKQLSTPMKDIRDGF